MTEGCSFLKNKQEKNKTKKHKNVFKKERKTKMLNIPSSNKKNNKNFKSFIEKMKTFFLIVIITSIISGVVGAKIGYDFAKNNSESTASAITEAVKNLKVDEKNIVKK